MISSPEQQAVDAAITSRRSIRAFQSTPVSREDIEAILEVAALRSQNALQVRKD